MPIKEELTINKLHNILSKSQLTISTAESCTGGIISSELTRLPNSSLYFIGAIIAYQNTIKRKFTGCFKLYTLRMWCRFRTNR